MISEQAVRQRLNALIKESSEDDYTSVSALIGKNHAYMQQYIRRGNPRRLKEQDRRKLAWHFGIPEWELGGPDADYETAPAQHFSETRGGGVVLIPSYDVKASAGAGTNVEYDSVDQFLPFRASWLREVSSSSPSDLTVICVRGDSMYPTLSDGDNILVDLTATEPGRDGIYVLRSGGDLHVKRISLSPTKGRITVKSDNPLYESWENCEPSGIDIVGRVVWVGRKL